MKHLYPLIFLLVYAPGAFAQSRASQASSLSLQASAEAASLTVLASHEGSQFVVNSLRPIGEMVELSMEAVGTSAVAVIRVSADAVRAAGIVIGTTIEVTASVAGWSLRAGSELIAFVPNQVVRAHMHHRKL